MTNLCILFRNKLDSEPEYFTRTSFLKYWKDRGHDIFACPKTKKN